MLTESAQKPNVREITLRVAMTAVLAPLGIWVVLQGGWALKIACMTIGVIAAFEWTRMAAKPLANMQLPLFATAAIGAVACVWFTSFGLEVVLIASLVTAALSSVIAILRGAAWRTLAFGAIYTSLPFGAFVWMRETAPDAATLCAALLAIVWATDIAAYFAGRGFGGPLLSPLDSPNKTWTGAIGALVCACLAGAAIARAIEAPLAPWLVASALISIVAQGGDLLESRFKRQFKVKDTSGLIPGHGGVLDRIDALMAAVVMAALVLRLFPAVGQAMVAGGSA